MSRKPIWVITKPIKPNNLLYGKKRQKDKASTSKMLKPEETSYSDSYGSKGCMQSNIITTAALHEHPLGDQPVYSGWCSVRKRPQPPIHFLLHTSRTVSCHFIPPSTPAARQDSGCGSEFLHPCCLPSASYHGHVSQALCVSLPGLACLDPGWSASTRSAPHCVGHGTRSGPASPSSGCASSGDTPPQSQRWVRSVCGRQVLCT